MNASSLDTMRARIAIDMRWRAHFCLAWVQDLADVSCVMNKTSNRDGDDELIKCARKRTLRGRPAK